MIKERRKEKKAGIVREKKDLLDVLMDMYDQETNSVMDDEELRSQVQKLHILNYHFNNNNYKLRLYCSKKVYFVLFFSLLLFGLVVQHCFC